MKSLRRLGVYLNDEPGDKEALAFAGLLAKLESPESIHCLHVRGIEDPAETPVPEPEKLRALLLEVLPEELARSMEIHVSAATGLQAMLCTARDHDLDMIVVGRRLPHDQLGVGAAFYRLARKTPCDVLVVPEGAHAHLSRLLALVDGSEHSRMAVETALRLARASGEKPQVLVQSIYCVSYGYHYTGMTFEEAAQQRALAQREKIEQFLSDVDTSGVEFEVVYTCSRDTAAAAHDLASAKNMDAIVVGSRGATLPAIALLGATTERVLVNAPMPVLVVKRKGETFRFLDALLESFQVPG
jgi:nucleotide-binding universal stress UspA family protein